jgi:hypothetical protein
MRRPIIQFPLVAAVVLAVACEDNGTANTELIGLEVVIPTITVAQGAVGSTTTIVTRSASVTRDVALAVSGMPSGMTVDVVPDALPSGAYTARIDVEVSTSVTTGTYTLTVRATAAGAEAATHSLTVVVVSPASGSFSLRALPASVEMRPTDTDSVAIGIERVGVFTGAVTLRLVGLPPGMSGSVSPASATGGTAILRLATAQVAAGTYDVTVLGTGNGVPDASVSVTVFVTTTEPTPLLALSLDPSEVTLVAGGPSVPVTVNITRLGTFTGAVYLYSWGWPTTGVSVTITPSGGITGSSATMTVQAPAGLAPDSYGVVVFGESGEFPPLALSQVWLPITVVAGT